MNANALARTVACPTCRADVGKPCRSLTSIGLRHPGRRLKVEPIELGYLEKAHESRQALAEQVAARGLNPFNRSGER